MSFIPYINYLNFILIYKTDAQYLNQNPLRAGSREISVPVLPFIHFFRISLLKVAYFCSSLIKELRFQPLLPVDEKFSELASFQELLILYRTKPAIECSRTPVKAIRIPKKVSSSRSKIVSPEPRLSAG